MSSLARPWTADVCWGVCVETVLVVVVETWAALAALAALVLLLRCTSQYREGEEPLPPEQERKESIEISHVELVQNVQR